ncbi:MAG TPA: 2-oxoglutarate and iron-dependent oxygenase domain-containing protein [Stellaceae bacterium]|nr:2-oxoglutarate and iron-dependent oxygenase domain-containing protein [Stellaceae bacterium]
MDEHRGLARERRAVTKLPVIDLAPFIEGGGFDERRAVAQALREACIDIGFFYLAGHGIPQQEFDEVIALGHRFFELPLPEKMKLHSNNSPARLGYRGLGGPNPGASPDKIPDIKERFHMNREVLPGEPEDGRRGAGLTQWPDEALVPGFTAVMKRHISARCAVAQHLARAFALSLDLPESYFDAMYRYPNGSLVLNYYPAVDPAALRDQQWSFSPHADYNAFTLLYQDENGGLQLLNAAGDWIDADPIPGTMVVNIGDTFQRWTNDLYTSTLHRVINKSAQARISAPLFASPNGATIIRCLESCTGPGNPPRYEPVESEEFVKGLLEEAYRTGLPTLGAKTAERLHAS